MCEYSSHLCSNTGCKEVENLEDMDTHLKGSCGYRAVGVCQRGCGLVLPHKELVQGNHCCLSALRAQNGALQVKSARLEQAAKKERLEFGVREQFLLAQVSALQNEARLTALNYQKKLRQYMVHINNITKQLLAGHNKGEYDQPLSITLQEVEDSLDFKISSGQQGLEATGVGMSHLSERGPAALRDGPQVHDRILEVNGKDLSKATPDEAVEAFCHARDPIVVQVLRRSPAPRSHGNSQEICLVDVCTQTDITFEHIMALSKLRPPTPPLPDICPFLLSDSCHSLQTMEQEFYEGTEYLSHIPASCDRAEEYEYEEVELCRQNSQEKLGLTLCYRTDDEEDVGIYVSEVGPDSIAARDGRIREGDRILQINGQDIQNKEEAVTVLSNEDCINILLLVARPEIQLDEGWLDDEQNDFLEELKMEMLEEQRKDEIKHSAVQQPRERDEVDEEIRADVATCSSNVQDEASTEGDTPSRVQSRSTHGLQDRNRVPGEQLDSDCTTPQADEEDEEDEEECERFQQLLELKCQIRNSGEYDLYYSRRSTIECSLGEPEGMQRELRLLNEELRSIELECQNIMQAHQLRLTQNQSPGGSPMVNKPAHICELPEKSDKDRDKDKDSSSAYNTAESCRSTPLAMRRSSDNSLQRTVSTANLKNLRATAAAQSRQAKPGILEQKEASPSPSPSPSLSPSPYLSPYRHANIPAHARHYQSYMHLIQQRSAVEYGQSQLSLLSMCKDPQRPGESSRTEWKVKVRSDGTRYITKRPVRDRLLRERALKIREERGGGGGTTTDDDAASELKMGRYWSKEERKQHLLRAREQRRRREFMMRSRLESLRENPQSGGEGGRKEVSILELSHRKMMKKRNRKILDNWMTIQELMTHGARTPEDTSVHNAFLSVTTV